MTTYPMKCRYDREGHGDFANGIALRQHYNAVHPEYVAPAPRAKVQAEVVSWSATPDGLRQAEPVQCDACGVTLRRGSFAKHKKTRHGGVARIRSAARAELLATVSHPETQRLPQAHTAPDPEPLTVDEIVLPAIAVMAMPGNVVPVAHLAALFAWRDATAVMLAAVGHRAVNGT